MSKSPQTILQKLGEIQNTIKVPKNKWNEFGKYYYRDNETIIETVKPVAHELGCVVVQHDCIVEVGGRIYVKATTELVDMESGEKAEVSAFAREAESLKGQMEAMITGGASSYARKYSANGLFALDDSDDPDHPREDGTKKKKTAPSAPAKPDKPWLNQGTADWKKAVLVAKKFGNIDKLMSIYSISKANQELLKESIK